MELPQKGILLILFFALVNYNINACSCDTISFDKAINIAEEIFVGKIVKVERFKNGKFINVDGIEEINWDWKYYFQVKKKWKGNRQSELIVHHQGTSCDYFFNIYEEEYLVYASRKPENTRTLGITVGPNNGKNNLSTWLCSRTIYGHYWDDDNWFKVDVQKLDKTFPVEIQLVGEDKNQVRLVVGGILLLGIILGLVHYKVINS